MIRYLPTSQIFACFSVPMYDPVLDRMVEVLANDNYELIEDAWLYTGIQNKLAALTDD